jgi:hypothetical protein
MEPKKYSINKGVNRPLEFRGLQAQYIWYLAAALLLVLVTFAILYLLGINIYADVPMCLVLGGLLVTRIYRLSRKYGQYGIMKKRARKAIPAYLPSHSRKCFTQLFKDHVGRTRSAAPNS